MKPSLLIAIVLSAFTFFCNTQTSAKSDPTGEWVTDRGVMKLTREGDKVTGTFVGGGTVSGSLDGKTYKLDCVRGEDKWKGEMELDADGQSFKGKTTDSYSEGVWRGWKRDPDAATKPKTDVSGYWLTNWGNLNLKQDGDKLSGFYSSARWGQVEGKIQGRKLDLKWQRFGFRGKAELEISPDGSRIYGLDTGENSTPWFGLRPKGFTHHVEPKAGEIVNGIADNGMLYFLRMPEGWQSGQPVDVVILLHGSNWTTAGMVFVTNKNWPEIGKKFAILGIQGESWAKWSDVDDLRFNYTYVNWVGRSKLGGYPGTDRESPYLVGELLDEFSELYKFKRIFLGGHSQGGYLAYMMHMHFPEKLAGTFPIAGGMIIQAEPDAFDNDLLMERQRELPMAIIHGKSDNVVPFSMGEYAYNRLLNYGFHKVKLISPNLGHPYDFLPIDEAIHYLDMLTTEDEAQLLAFAQSQVTKKNWRDVGLAVARAKEIKGGKAFSEIWQKLQEASKKDAARLLREIEQNANNKWVDRYLEYQFNFQNADAAKPVIEAFEKLREQHAEPAEKLMTEARKAFQNGQRDQGYAHYQEIVDKHYASVHYPTAKSMLKEKQ